MLKFYLIKIKDHLHLDLNLLIILWIFFVLKILFYILKMVFKYQNEKKKKKIYLIGNNMK